MSAMTGRNAATRPLAKCQQWAVLDGHPAGQPMIAAIDLMAAKSPECKMLHTAPTVVGRRKPSLVVFRTAQSGPWGILRRTSLKRPRSPMSHFAPMSAARAMAKLTKSNLFLLRVFHQYRPLLAHRVSQGVIVQNTIAEAYCSSCLRADFR